MDEEPMTDAELRVVREYLGLTGDALGQLLGVQGRSVRNWEAGKYAIPDGVRDQIEAWEASTAEQVTAAIEAVNAMVDPAIATYRSDADYWGAQPQMEPWPAAWHRAIVARVAQEVPGLVIAYRNDVDV